MSYVFDHWELDGVDIGSSNPVDITMDKNHTLVAVFKPSALLSTPVIKLAYITNSPTLNNPTVSVNGTPNIANSPTLNNPTISFS